MKRVTPFSPFPSAQTDSRMGHKSGLNRNKKTQIIPCIFSHHNAMKLEVNQKKKKKIGKTINIWRLKNIRMNVLTRKVQKIKVYMEINENENTTV